MATTKGPRYARLPLGLTERVLGLVSAHAALVYVRLRLSQEKRSVPGLLRVGEGGLADLLGLTPTALRKALVELERAELVLVDRPSRLVYCVGAVEEDGPRTVQTVKAFAAQLRELPAASPVTVAVVAAVHRALVSQHEALAACWAAEVVSLEPSLTASLDSSLDPRETASDTATLTVLPIPIPIPRSDPEYPNPIPKNGKAAAAPPSAAVGVLAEAATNLGVITRVAHEVLDCGPLPADDLTDGVKARCATLRIAYDSRTVAKAIDSAQHQRRVSPGVRH